MVNTHPQITPRVSTGIPGLDEVMHGGFPPNRLYLVEGDPGSGKTTLALQFLIEGAQNGESCLFVTLSESEEELRSSAASHGWPLDGISVVEPIASDQALKADSRYTMFHPSEVELSETTRVVLEKAEQIRPTRLVFDSLSDLRLLAQNSFRYRRQILALKQYFTDKKCTVLLIDDKTGDPGERHLHSVAHGVVSLERISNDFGAQHRRLEIRKLRGCNYRAGYHDFRIVPGGVEVYPRLVASEHKTSYAREPVKSGVVQLDALLGGGLARGTSTLILGPAGSGKSTLAAQYVTAAAANDLHGVIYIFDESIATYLERSAGLGMDVEGLMRAGKVELRQVDPAELSAGEFAYIVQRQVEEKKSRIVVIDSLNGYLNSMPNERFLTLHLHEMLTYLGQQGVTTILLMAQHGLVGQMGHVPVDASYLADTVVMTRYFEVTGEVRQAVSVIKKRTGYHERSIRELRFAPEKGLSVGEPLREFQGVLNGTTVYVGRDSAPETKAKS